MKILIVDDNLPYAALIKNSILSWNYDAEISETGEDALKLLREKPFELILLDIYLPDCMGYELIPKIKGIKYDIGIVTMTGFNSKELELEVRQQGIFCYLIKPFSLVVLKELIDHISKMKQKEIRKNSAIRPKYGSAF